MHDISGGDDALFRDVMFHAQQAAEKALKAFLAWHGVFRKTHSLEELGRQCVALEATLEEAVNDAVPKRIRLEVQIPRRNRRTGSHEGGRSPLGRTEFI